jgi:hypothetical protein
MKESLHNLFEQVDDIESILKSTEEYLSINPEEIRYFKTTKKIKINYKYKEKDLIINIRS